MDYTHRPEPKNFRAFVDSIPKDCGWKPALVKLMTELDKMKLRDDDFCRRENDLLRKHAAAAKDDFEKVTGEWVDLVSGQTLGVLVSFRCRVLAVSGMKGLGR